MAWRRAAVVRTPYGWFYSRAGPERRKPREDDAVRSIVRRDARVTERPDRRRQREGATRSANWVCSRPAGAIH